MDDLNNESELINYFNKNKQPRLFNLILSGSGSRYLSFLGSLSFFQSIYKNFNNSNLGLVICSSGGSFIGLLLCLGYKINDIKNLLLNIGYNDIKNINIMNLFTKYGIDEGNKIIDILKKLIYNKLGNENATFKDLYDIKGNHLIITGSCINTYKIEYFDHFLYPDLELWKAVRISISIPLYFTACPLGEKIFCDGAILDYFPINPIKMYKSEISENDVIIGIRLKDPRDENDIRPINSFQDYLINVISCFITTIEKLRNDKLLENEIHNNFVNENNLYIIPLVTHSSGYTLELDENNRKQLFDESFQFTKKHFINKYKKLYEKDLTHEVCRNICLDIIDDI